MTARTLTLHQRNLGSSPTTSSSLLRLPVELFTENILPQLLEACPSTRRGTPLTNFALVCRSFRNYAYSVLWCDHRISSRESFLAMLEMSTSPRGKHNLILDSIRSLQVSVNVESGVDVMEDEAEEEDWDEEEPDLGIRTKKRKRRHCVIDGYGNEVPFSLNHILAAILSRTTKLTKLSVEGSVADTSGWTMGKRLQEAILGSLSLKDLTLGSCDGTPADFRLAAKKGAPFDRIAFHPGNGREGLCLPPACFQNVDSVGLKELMLVLGDTEHFDGKGIGAEVWKCLEVLELHSDELEYVVGLIKPFIEEAYKAAPLPLVELHIKYVFADLEDVLRSLPVFSLPSFDLRSFCLNEVGKPSPELIDRLAELFPNLEELEMICEADKAEGYSPTESPVYWHKWGGGSMTEYAKAFAGFKNLKVLSWNYLEESPVVFPTALADRRRGMSDPETLFALNGPERDIAREAYEEAYAKTTKNNAEVLQTLGKVCRKLEKVSLVGKWPSHLAFRIRRRRGDDEKVDIEDMVWEADYWSQTLEEPVPRVGRHKVPKTLFLTE